MKKRSDFVKALQGKPIKLDVARSNIQYTPIDRKKYEMTEELKQRRHT